MFPRRNPSRSEDRRQVAAELAREAGAVVVTLQRALAQARVAQAAFEEAALLDNASYYEVRDGCRAGAVALERVADYLSGAPASPVDLRLASATARRAASR